MNAPSLINAISLVNAPSHFLWENCCQMPYKKGFKTLKFWYICPHFILRNIVFRTSELQSPWGIYWNKHNNTRFWERDKGGYCNDPNKSGQRVQTQIRLLLEEEQSDQDLHCLQFRLHLLGTLLFGKSGLFKFWGDYSKFLGCPNI